MRDRAEAARVLQHLCRGERDRVSAPRPRRGKTREATFEALQRERAARIIRTRESRRDRYGRLSLLDLREPFLQPGRGAPFRPEMHEAVRHLVLENGEKLRRDAR